MSEGIRELKARITALELNVHKLVALAAAGNQAFAQASAMVVECAQCENPIEGRRSCPEANCPCGLPAKTKAKPKPRAKKPAAKTKH